MISRENLRGIAGVMSALAIIALIHFVKPGITAAPDFACNSDTSVSVEIDVRTGETGSEIARELFDKGVTASYDSFFRVAVGDSRSGRIAPGVHNIDKKICSTVALDQLLDPKRIGNLLAINEGAWNSEVISKLSQIGYSKSEISQAFKNTKRPEGFTYLEGLLFPAQYSFDSGTTVSKILEMMITRGVKEVTDAGLSQGQGKFSSQQLLTIASLIQAEGDTKDFAKISRVIRNRLAIGMRLQFDSTIHYIKGTRGSIFLSTKSTLLKSPYNSYQRYGLPPGPINNPGSDAMHAATHPDAGVWLYFITVAPGDTRFTDSLDEFNNWKILYKKNLKAGKFGSK